MTLPNETQPTANLDALMPVEEDHPLPSAHELRQAAIATAKVRLLPGRWLPRYSVPLRCGVPLPRGKVTGPVSAWLVGPNDEVLPAQFAVLSKWPDGSMRWALIDVMMPAMTLATEWLVSFLDSASVATRRKGIELHSTAEQATLRTGVIDVTLNSRSGLGKIGFPPANRTVAEYELPGITPANPQELPALPVEQRRRWECDGPLRATLNVEASYPTLGGLQLRLRQSFFAASGLIQVELCLQNPQRARHRGGLWDLGDAGSILFQDLSFRIGGHDPDPSHVEYQLEPGGAWIDSTPRFALHQESSGGERWDSINHVDRTGTVPWRHPGYRGQSPNEEIAGKRATPAVRFSSPQAIITATLPNFWQQFPKSLSVDAPGNSLAFGLFPPRDGQPYELQGGEQKTHTLWLKFDPPGTSADDADLSWVHDPPRLVPVIEEQPLLPGWPRISPLDAAPVATLDALCGEVLDGPASVFARREAIDEYGWRNFGEFFADHETVYYRGERPLISHYNNQYDVLGGLLLQGLRTDERRWWSLAENLARHVTDIDLYHTTEDRAVFNGGLFWLTDHYTSCGTATHRCFSRLNAAPGRQYGGGPGAEHNYTTGLLAYHWLTGDPAAKDAVVQLAEWVMAMEDGRHTVFGLFDDGPTGLATTTAQPEYHGPGRGAGNSINALLDAWLLTNDRKYLAFAESLLRRCIHPGDDIAALDLLNFELRWSYTVFLMAVMKYLECKAEANEFDVEYEFARQSLLHYAAWMAENERPYFERAEQMEFPTETWGAQELRKANVFRWAARYADEPLRSRLQRKGQEFAERAWHDLCRFPTRTFIRPFTLAMIQGLWDAALRGDDAVYEGRGPALHSWGEPAKFVPQKLRVKRMLKSPRGIATALLRGFDPRRWGSFLEALRRMA